LIVGWCGRFLFFVVPRQFSLDAGEWSESQILIPDWTYFHCPGATLDIYPLRSRINFIYIPHKLLIPGSTPQISPKSSFCGNPKRDRKEEISLPLLTIFTVAGSTDYYSP